MTLIRLSLFTETEDLNLVLAGVGVTLDTVNTCSEKCFVSLGGAPHPTLRLRSPATLKTRKRVWVLLRILSQR